MSPWSETFCASDGGKVSSGRLCVSRGQLLTDMPGALHRLRWHALSRKRKGCSVECLRVTGICRKWPFSCSAERADPSFAHVWSRNAPGRGGNPQLVFLRPSSSRLHVEGLRLCHPPLFFSVPNRIRFFSSWTHMAFTKVSGLSRCPTCSCDITCSLDFVGDAWTRFLVCFCRRPQDDS